MIARALVISLAFATAASAAPADDVNAVLKSFTEAFNKGDAKAAAAMFADDGDLYNPAGVYAKGKAAAEKVIAADLAGILKGTTQSITADNVREIGKDTLLVDATHEAKGMKTPDGKTTDGKIHVVFVMKGKGSKLQIVAARPYLFLPPPPAGAPPAK